MGVSRASSPRPAALPRDANMQYNKISVWWDGEGDFLWVNLADGEGDMLPTRDGKSTVKVDADGNVLGFQIFGVSKRAKRKPFGFELTPQSEPAKPQP